MMQNLPQIFKKIDRCSESNMPLIGTRCMFSHALQLTIDEFVPHKKLFEREEIHQGARAKVLAKLGHVVRVRFEHSDRDDIVSPEFLIPLELTRFGRELLESDPKLLAAVEKITTCTC